MSVWITANLVSFVDGEVRAVSENDPTYFTDLDGIAHLVYDRDNFQKLIAFTQDQCDLSFFTRSNESTYGDKSNTNVCFTADHVLELLSAIENMLMDKNNPWYGLNHYIDLTDDSGKEIREAIYVDEQNGDATDCLAKIRLSDTQARLDLYSLSDNKRIGSLDLNDQQPTLYYFQEETTHQFELGRPIKWVVTEAGYLEDENGKRYKEAAVARDGNSEPLNIHACYVGKVEKEAESTWLQLFELATKKPMHKIDLRAEEPRLYSFTFKRTSQRDKISRIQWTLNKESYKDWVNKDVAAIKGLCKVAKENNYCLQIRQD